MTIDLSAFDLPIGRNLLSEYFGHWAILPDRFDQLVQRVSELNIRAHVEANQASYQAVPTISANPYALSSGIAQIELIGPMMKFSSSVGSNVSTVYARKQIRHAAKNPEVKAIFLRIDSPGGTVSGTKDLADEIARTKAIKPVVAFVEDLSASAAYWVAAQSTEIIANNTTALIGSIGTYAVIYDYSKRNEKLGIKTHVIGTGPHKGAGAPGSEITPAQLAEFQRVIDSLNGEFLAAVGAGRKLSSTQVAELADGRVHPAIEAKALKLIDRIDSFDSVFEHYSGRRPAAKASLGKSDITLGNEVATIEQLESISSDPAFVFSQFRSKATYLQAITEHCRILEEENRRLKAEFPAQLAQARQQAADETWAEFDREQARQRAFTATAPTKERDEFENFI